MVRGLTGWLVDGGWVRFLVVWLDVSLIGRLLGRFSMILMVGDLTDVFISCQVS
jgi:hypothetical protein